MIKYFLFVLILALTNTTFAEHPEDDVVETETEGDYLMRDGDSKQIAKALAMYEATRQSVETAGRYLAKRSLVEVYELKKDEIYSLVTGLIKAEILEEKWQPVGNTSRCIVKIKARVRDSDFIKAEMLNSELERQDLKESFREEMEPTVSKKIDPGTDLAKAYRLLRKREWRMAMLYLDRLHTKYPNWHEIPFAKAMGYYALHEPVSMKRSLERACDLGSQRACNDLRTLKKVHDIDMGL